MRVYLAACLLALSGGLWAQGTHATRSQITLRTFTSSDGAFQFQYPEPLTPCEQRKQQSGDGYYWVQDSCGGYGGAR